MLKYDIRSGVRKIKTKTALAISALGIGAAGVTGSLLLFGSAHAVANVVVTPQNQQGWSTADTRPGGNVTFVNDSTAPGGSALSLTTVNSGAAKAQYQHTANDPLANVTELSYSTKQNTASFAQGDPSYQLLVNLNGTNGFTTFVFEPYENTGTVTNGDWQTWDVDAGQMWSSRTVNTISDTCHTVAGAGGPPFYTLSELKANCPNAVVIGFGVNIGSNNPTYDTEADLVDYNGTVYDFQTAPSPVTLTNKDQCKNGGWATANDPSFKNQGDCVSYFATKGKNLPAGSTSYDHYTYGSATLNSPLQQINFSGNTATNSGTFTYTNAETVPVLNYTTNLTCVNVVGNTAYMAYVIPTGNAYSGTWVVWKVVDGASDTAGFSVASDMASANALCQSGFTPSSYGPVTPVAGDIVVQ